MRPRSNPLTLALSLGMASALMFGWTALLVWGSRRPVERRGILLLTVCPVIAGLALTAAYAYASGYITRTGAISVWTFQALLCAVFLSAHRQAVALARREGPG